MTPLEEIPSKRKSYKIVEQIVELIQKGEYSKGDKLPSERETAEKLGVSRPLVREAYSALQLSKIIVTRPGDGTYINRDSFAKSDFLPQISSILQEGKDPIEVWKARESIETGSMALVVEEYTADDLQALEKAIAGMKEAVDDDDYQSYFDSDRIFHIGLAKATHNPYLEKTITSLVDVMKGELWQEIKRTYFLERGTHFYESLGSHKSILEAIREGDKSEATEKMREHFTELKTVYGNKEG